MKSSKIREGDTWKAFGGTARRADPAQRSTAARARAPMTSVPRSTKEYVEWLQQENAPQGKFAKLFDRTVRTAKQQSVPASYEPKDLAQLWMRLEQLQVKVSDQVIGDDVY